MAAPDLDPQYQSIQDPQQASEMFAALLASIQAMMPQQVKDVYGYIEGETITEDTMFEGTPVTLEYESDPTPITAEDIFDVVGGLSEGARKTFAMDMFLNAPGSRVCV